MSQGFTKDSDLFGSGAADRIAFWTAAKKLFGSDDLRFDGADLLLGSGIRARMSGQNRFRHLNSMVLATETTNQTISSGVVTLITLDDADVVDTDDLHEGVTNPARLTAKLSGLYLIYMFARLQTDASTSHSTVLLIEKNSNGTHDNAKAVLSGHGPVHSSSANICVTGLVQLAANDHVEAWIFQNSGSNQAIQSATNPAFFGMAYLGE